MARREINYKLKIIHVLRIIAAVIVRYILKLYYRNGGIKIGQIRDPVLMLPAVEVARKIRNREITSVEVLKSCIRRIKEVNPVLNCLVEDRFDDAMNEAKAVDYFISSESKSKEYLEKEKPFLGVPFTTKDSIAVKGLRQTSGIVSRKDVIAEEDSHVITLLRNKGAIVIGITNIPELCMWWETYNRIYGRTNNPYDTTRTSGGSSGGEASILASAGSIFGIGSDIGGSIRLPACFNGIFGHKPSRNIVSIEGMYLPGKLSDLLRSFICIGPMCKHAVDLKPILKIIAGENASKLNLDDDIDFKSINFYYQYTNNAPFVDNVKPDIIKIMNEVIDFLKSKRINVEEKNLQILKKSGPIWLATVKSKTRFGKFIMNNDSNRSLILEIVKSIFGLSNHTLMPLAIGVVDNIGLKVGDRRHEHYVKLLEDAGKSFDQMLGNNGVFLYPTHPTSAPYHNEPLIKPWNFTYTAIINCLGLPATTVPLGFDTDGLPIGIQIIANINQDRLCLAVAEKLEKEFGGWIAPK